MKNGKIKDLLQTAIAGTISGLLVWHVISWHIDGTHERMHQDIVSGGALIPVFYNLSLVIVLALALSLSLQGLISALGYRVTRIHHFKDEPDS